jgi:hypothetical protein
LEHCTAALAINAEYRVPLVAVMVLLMLHPSRTIFKAPVEFFPKAGAQTTLVVMRLGVSEPE